MKALVYFAKNRLNGDEYVGATEKELLIRKSKHLWHAANQPLGKFHRALAKYGAENFEWGIIEHCADFFEALEAERRAIALRRPAYNLTTGGGGVKGYKHTEAAKLKMSEAKRGKPSIWTKRPMPVHIRERLAACRRAEKGMERSARAKAALRENVQKAVAARRRQVINLVTGEIYESAARAAAALGLSRATLQGICAGTRKNCTAFKFGYVGGAA